MKERKILFLSLAILLFIACNESFDKNLPETDTSQFISGNSVVFPRGTKVIDVYNTVASIFFDNEWHDISDGEWKYIETADGETPNDGLINQVWETVTFYKIKHTSRDHRGYIVHSLYLYTDDSDIKEISFDWHGEWVVVDVYSAMSQIEGDIVFKIL